MQYEHHDVASDEAARAYLQSRGITALPVTIIDDDEVIIGYYPKKLIPALRLESRSICPAKRAGWRTKYDTMLGATLRAMPTAFRCAVATAPALA